MMTQMLDERLTHNKGIKTSVKEVNPQRIKVSFSTENFIDILDSKKFKFCTLIIVRSKKGNNTFVHHNNDNL